MDQENKPKGNPDHSMLIVKDLIEDCRDIIEIADAINIWRPAAVFAGPDGKATAIQKKHRDNLITDMNDPRFPREVYEATVEAVYKGLEFYMHFMELGSYGGGSVLQHEGLQLLKYEQGQGFYKKHVDGWTADTRQVSVLVYLNTVEEGGETFFPRQNTKVKPIENQMIFFPSNYSYPHEALAPISGPKYAIVSWFSIKKS